MFARRRTSKSQLLKKLQKSSSFSFDNQRQISLVLNHTYRNRKRLISLTNSQTFFEIIRLARCEYSKLVSVSSCSKESVLVLKERCATIQRDVSVFVLLKKILFALTSKEVWLNSCAIQSKFFFEKNFILIWIRLKLSNALRFEFKISVTWCDYS